MAGTDPQFEYGTYPADWYPSRFMDRAEWVQFWVGKHSPAYHGGHPRDCEHCMEMIADFGSMPPADEVEAADQEHSRMRRAESGLSLKARIPRSLRTAVFERDAYRCQHCGGWKDLRVDHIHPESLGGTLDMENLQTLCQSCNSRKGNRIS